MLTKGWLSNKIGICFKIYVPTSVNTQLALLSRVELFRIEKFAKSSRIELRLDIIRDSVKIMAFYGRKAINNFPNPSQEINYFSNFLKKINNGNNGKFSKTI